MLAGREISDDELEELLDEVTAASAGLSLTFFEDHDRADLHRLRAAAPPDIALVETGLGGRLDCTNVIEKPLATIITASPSASITRNFSARPCRRSLLKKPGS